VRQVVDHQRVAVGATVALYVPRRGNEAVV
jgi:hypothetical protein